MSRFVLLSAEISRERALLAGGASGRDVLRALREWLQRRPTRGRLRLVKSLIHWNEILCAAIHDALPLGAPVGRLLREIHPMIRREEKLWVRLQGLERQFGFQGAIAVVLPWAVGALGGDIDFNPFTAAGAVFQLAGLLAFYAIIRSATRRPGGETAWVFDLLVAAWMRALAGMSLRASLLAGLEAVPGGEFRELWKSWLLAREGGAAVDFRWPAHMPASRELSIVLAALLTSGAPAGEALAESIAQLDDERQAGLEERLAAVPTRLSLAFCGFFAPAVFLILLGGLWPSLSVLAF